jgi:hypothetical protein
MTKCQLVVLIQMLPLLAVLLGTAYCRRCEREDRIKEREKRDGA